MENQPQHLFAEYSNTAPSPQNWTACTPTEGIMNCHREKWISCLPEQESGCHNNSGFPLENLLSSVLRAERDNVCVPNLSVIYFPHICPSPSPHLCFGLAPEILGKILKYCVVPMGHWEGTERGSQMQITTSKWRTGRFGQNLLSQYRLCTFYINFMLVDSDPNLKYLNSTYCYIYAQ